MAPPGLVFLARIALTVLSKPLLFGLLIHHGSRRLNASAPVWATVLIATASLPLYGAARLWITDRRQRAEADVMGARMAPRVAGKLPGGLDLMQRIVHARTHGYVGDVFAEMFAEHGPVVNIRILWEDMIFTICPDHVKQILATDFHNYEKGDRFKRTMNSVLGTGVFNSDAEMWKFHRAMTRPFFSKERVSHFEVLSPHADRVIAVMRERIRAGYAVDFQDLIGRFTMDSATETLFGTCVDSLHGSVPYAHNAQPPFGSAQSSFKFSEENEFIEAFNEAMDRIAIRDSHGELWPLWEFWEESTKAPMAVVDRFLDPILKAAVQRKRARVHATAAGNEENGEKGHGDGEEQTLLDSLLDSTEDVKILKDETLNILLAGRDTTMHTMTMVIYFLSMYPEVCRRLRAEVLLHVGPAQRPTYEHIKNMKYLRAVLNESLRLYPPVPLNRRDSIQATTWSSPDPTQKPIYIPAGVKTPYSVMLMQRRTDLWGPDAEEFDPDRFLDDRVKTYLLNNAFQFLPFNAGPRICLGQQFAYNEMSFMIIRLLQSFSTFELDEAAFAPDARPPPEWKGAPGRKGVDRFRPAMRLTMSTADGMWVKATETE